MSLPTKQSMTERFLEFHSNNPEFYRTLVRFALEAKASGLGKYGMGDVIGRARWSFDVETQTSTDDFFKVNDLVSSFYARLIMTCVPELDGFFNVRSHPGSEPDAWIKQVVAQRAAEYGEPAPRWYVAHFGTEGGN